jgi:hypothetical protein
MADGQITAGSKVVKPNARKLRRLATEPVPSLGGFAGVCWQHLCALLVIAVCLCCGVKAQVLICVLILVIAGTQTRPHANQNDHNLTVLPLTCESLCCYTRCRQYC